MAQRELRLDVMNKAARVAGASEVARRRRGWHEDASARAEARREAVLQGRVGRRNARGAHAGESASQPNGANYNFASVLIDKLAVENSGK